MVLYHTSNNSDKFAAVFLKMNHMSKNKIFVISAPSGAGKSTLVNALCKLDNTLQLSISHTTREKRTGEEHGKNYFFVSSAEFAAMIKDNQFLEYATIYGNYYGTNIQAIKNLLLNQNKDIILELDWQGARHIKQIFNHAVLIFILPPSLETLEKRLRLRNTDSDETIINRINNAQQEISHVLEFDYVIINDNFDIALHELRCIISAQRNQLKDMLSTINTKFLLKE